MTLSYFDPQITAAQEEAERLRWQLKMMIKAQDTPEKASASSWILGCVSNRKQ